MPEGPPPGVEEEPVDSDDDIPMPEGPPPGKDQGVCIPIGDSPGSCASSLFATPTPTSLRNSILPNPSDAPDAPTTHRVPSAATVL